MSFRLINSRSCRFAVVEFPTEEDDQNELPVEIIPVLWMSGDGNSTAWPPSLLRATRLAEREVIPKDNWSQHNIRVLRYCGKKFIINIIVLSNLYYIGIGALVLQHILLNYGVCSSSLVRLKVVLGYLSCTYGKNT